MSDSGGLGWLAFFAALFTIGAAISAGLAFYFSRKVHFKDAEASAMFALIFSIAALLMVLIFYARTRSVFSRVKGAATVFKSGVTGAAAVLRRPAGPLAPPAAPAAAT